jgi:hypothetical protein
MKYLFGFGVSQILTHLMIMILALLVQNVIGLENVLTTLYPEALIPVAIGGLLGTIVNVISDKTEGNL